MFSQTCRHKFKGDGSFLYEQKLSFKKALFLHCLIAIKFGITVILTVLQLKANFYLVLTFSNMNSLMLVFLCVSFVLLYVFCKDGLYVFTSCCWKIKPLFLWSILTRYYTRYTSLCLSPLWLKQTGKNILQRALCAIKGKNGLPVWITVAEQPPLWANWSPSLDRTLMRANSVITVKHPAEFCSAAARPVNYTK